MVIIIKYLIELAMGKRYISSFLRQAMLICSNQKKEFAFIRTPFNKLALPLVVVSQEHATYWAAIEKYCQDLGLKVNFQGICHMAIGNDGAFNFQRFVYYGTLRQAFASDHVQFRGLEEEGIQPEAYKLIKDLLKRRQVCSLDVFRENFKETAPRAPNFQPLLTIK